jgi:hypothetical protein
VNYPLEPLPGRERKLGAAVRLHRVVKPSSVLVHPPTLVSLRIPINSHTFPNTFLTVFPDLRAVALLPRDEVFVVGLVVTIPALNDAIHARIEQLDCFVRLSV